MEISVGNKQLHENKHAQRHSQSSEHRTVTVQTRATSADPERVVCSKESSWGGAVTLPGHECDLVCTHAHACLCLMKHMNFI